MAIQGHDADAKSVRELLSLWDIQFIASPEEAEIVLLYRGKLAENRKTIIIPSENPDFAALIKHLKLRVSKRTGESIPVATGRQTVLTIAPQIRYCYDGLAQSASDDIAPMATELSDDLISLSVDVANEYKKILSVATDADTSRWFRILTGLPIPYSMAPERLRNLVMRTNENHKTLTLQDRLPLDALRFILVKSIEKLSGTKLNRKSQNSEKCMCLLTHDVETSDGLKKSLILKKLEERYNVPSSWYIPAKHYRLDPEIVETLATHGEVGAHGNRHDGKLAMLPKKEMVDEICQARRTLENIIGKPIKGFRAPLLHCNKILIQALNEAGYVYDTSMPTWEPNHPSVMGPFGIGTVNLIRMNGILEVPLTLPQDHQMLHVLNMTAKQTTETWLRLMDVIRDIGGVCSILVHPDYELADPKNLSVYEELLNQVASDDENWIATPSQIMNG